MGMGQNPVFAFAKSGSRRLNMNAGLTRGIYLTFTESHITISAETQLVTLSAYLSSCWRGLS